MHFLEDEREDETGFPETGQGFKVIVESRTHANVLALIHAMLGGSANSRVLFMDTNCLRGMSLN